MDVGNSLVEDGDGLMHLEVSRPLPPEHWGFDASAIRRDAEGLQWPDEDLLQKLVYGFRYYEDSKPRVS